MHVISCSNVCKILSCAVMTSSVLDQPVSSLDTGTVICLGGELTLRNTKNRDWTGVASIVGFTYKQVQQLRQHQDSGTCLVLPYHYITVRMHVDACDARVYYTPVS